MTKLIKKIENIFNMKDLLRNMTNIDRLAKMIETSDKKAIMIIKEQLDIILKQPRQQNNTIKDSIQIFITKYLDSVQKLKE